MTSTTTEDDREGITRHPRDWPTIVADLRELALRPLDGPAMRFGPMEARLILTGIGGRSPAQADRLPGEEQAQGEAPSPEHDPAQLGDLRVAGEGVHQSTDHEDEQGEQDGSHASEIVAQGVPISRFGGRVRELWRRNQDLEAYGFRLVLSDLAAAIDQDADELRNEMAGRLTSRCEDGVRHARLVTRAWLEDWLIGSVLPRKDAGLISGRRIADEIDRFFTEG